MSDATHDIAQLQLELAHYRYEHESLEAQRDALAKQMSELRAERDELRDSLDSLRCALDSSWPSGEVSNLRAKFTAEREWLVKLLSRYGHHDKDCELHHEANLPGDSRCTCGFSASLA